MKIMLDAGHYGKYNKGVNPKYYESEMVWKLQNYLKTELEKYGVEVGTTRTDINKDLGLEARGKMSKGYDLFISLHSNAVNNSPATKKVITFEPLNGSCDGIAETITKAVYDAMDLTEDKYWGWEVLTKQYSSSKPNIDYYGVIRGAVSVGTPAMIIEHSFHTNEEACNWLLVDANIKKLAKAEADAIAKYYGLKAQTQTQTLYRVQVGVFSVKSNADNMLKKLKDAGFNGFIVEVDNRKSVEEIAKEVINGKWGNGVDRQKRLEQAGYNYSEVQACVNKLFTK